MPVCRTIEGIFDADMMRAAGQQQKREEQGQPYVAPPRRNFPQSQGESSAAAVSGRGSLQGAGAIEQHRRHSAARAVGER